MSHLFAFLFAALIFSASADDSLCGNSSLPAPPTTEEIRNISIGVEYKIAEFPSGLKLSLRLHNVIRDSLGRIKEAQLQTSSPIDLSPNLSVWSYSPTKIFFSPDSGKVVKLSQALFHLNGAVWPRQRNFLLFYANAADITFSEQGEQICLKPRSYTDHRGKTRYPRYSVSIALAESLEVRRLNYLYYTDCICNECGAWNQTKNTSVQVSQPLRSADVYTSDSSVELSIDPTGNVRINPNSTFTGYFGWLVLKDNRSWVREDRVCYVRRQYVMRDIDERDRIAYSAFNDYFDYEKQQKFYQSAYLIRNNGMRGSTYLDPSRPYTFKMTDDGAYLRD
jgi:hypothetical protein